MFGKEDLLKAYLKWFSGDNIAYIYPDMKTALVGKFARGLMVSLNVVVAQLNFSGPEFVYAKFSEVLKKSSCN